MKSFLMLVFYIGRTSNVIVCPKKFVLVMTYTNSGSENRTYSTAPWQPEKDLPRQTPAADISRQCMKVSSFLSVIASEHLRMTIIADY